jgi:hypothetical protein
MKNSAAFRELGDFTASRGVIPISLLAIVIGIFSSYIAYWLLKLIGLFTNLFYFGRFSTALVLLADPLLKGPVPLPPGAVANDVDGISPQDGPTA